MDALLLALALHVIHIGIGPHGWVAWIQPPHIAAGIGWVQGHIVTWFQWR